MRKWRKDLWGNALMEKYVNVPMDNGKMKRGLYERSESPLCRRTAVSHF